jgi:hypothetical protein
MKVIEALGVKDEVLRKTTFASDGVATMRLVLEEGVDLGVSQSSEILQANRDAMAGPFPKAFALATGGQRLRCSADRPRRPRKTYRGRSHASRRPLKAVRLPAPECAGPGGLPAAGV